MAFVIKERCVKCGACESECPNSAIVEEEKNSRSITRNVYSAGPTFAYVQIMQ